MKQAVCVYTGASASGIENIFDFILMRIYRYDTLKGSPDKVHITGKFLDGSTALTIYRTTMDIYLKEIE
ncbi:MAG: hypothetical protein DRJ03_19100 [Chloroflexi bacterium]|nr:MAG: hypothetical protein DRJ03_19100 [Chloroflexota bacterium]